MFLISAFPSSHGFPNMMTLQYGRNLEILFYNFTTFFFWGGGGEKMGKPTTYNFYVAYYL